MAKFRLSIFNFETLDRPSLRFPVAAVTALGLVLVCECLLHLFQNQLPEPVLWGEGGASVKVAMVQHRALRDDPSVDVLVLGPSHGSVGISPKEMLIAVADPKFRAFNGALLGRTYTTMYFLYKEIYKPILKPKVLILTVSPLLLNKYNKRWEKNSLEFFNSPMPKALSMHGVSRSWRLFLVEHVFLYKYRRRSQNLHKGMLNGKQILDKYGFRESTGVYNEEKKQEILNKTHPYQKIMRKFEFGGPSLEALKRILIDAKNSGVKSLVVNTPFRKDLLSISPDGQADYEHYLNEMENLRRQYQFIWIDYQKKMVFEDSDFRDVDHLNKEGAKKISRQLAKDMQSLLSNLTF